MSDLLDNINVKFMQLYHRIARDGKRYFQLAVSKGEEISCKGKVQIEIEQLKWELKHKYTVLGKYVTDNKESKSVIDFSHDHSYLSQINEIIQLRFYIEERKNKSKDHLQTKLKHNKI